MARNSRLFATMAAVTLAGGLCVTTGAGAALASTPDWQKVWRSWSWSTNQLLSVKAISASNAWAVGTRDNGDDAFVMHWNGSGWNHVSVPETTGFAVGEVRASSAKNVWLIGNNSTGTSGKILRWNGSSWADVPVPAGVNIYTSVVNGPSDAWVAGKVSCPDTDPSHPCKTTMYHWDGSTWSPSVVPATVDSMSGSGSGNVWVACEGGNDFIYPYYLTAYHWNGANWDFVSSMPQPKSHGRAGIVVGSAHNVWLGSWPASNWDGYLLHWNGTSWARLNSPSTLSTTTPLATDGNGGAWFGPYVHWTGSKWVNTIGVDGLGVGASYGIRDLSRIPGRTTMWGVGSVTRTASSSVWDSLIAVHGTVP